MMKKQIKTTNLDHLGIIAGICDDLEIENIIDSMIEKDVREKVSAGQIVKAIILNGLGEPIPLIRFYSSTYESSLRIKNLQNLLFFFPI